MAAEKASAFGSGVVWTWDKLSGQPSSGRLSPAVVTLATHSLVRWLIVIPHKHALYLQKNKNTLQAQLAASLAKIKYSYKYLHTRGVYEIVKLNNIKYFKSVFYLFFIFAYSMNPNRSIQVFAYILLYASELSTSWQIYNTLAMKNKKRVAL